MSDPKHYVMQDIEVKKTGRVAIRNVGQGKQPQQLVEVTPADENDGSWKKWVAEATLFLIIDPNHK